MSNKPTLKERQQRVWDGASLVATWIMAVGFPVVLAGCMVTAGCVLYGLARRALTWGAG